MSNYGYSPNNMIEKLMDILNDAVVYVFLNIFWLIFSIPIITIFPATGALYFTTNELAHRRVAGFAEFWEGFKKYFWTSYKWGLLLLISGYLFYMNIWFYDNLDWEYANYVRMFYVGFSILWAAMMVFTFPFLLEQEKPLLTTAIRNSLVVIAKAPLRALVITASIAIVAWVSTYIILILWFIMSMSIITFISNRGTIWILASLPKAGDSQGNQKES